MSEIQISKAGLIELMKQMGPHCWWVYSALYELSEGGMVLLTQDELAGYLGVSAKSIRRYLTKLTKLEINGQRLVTITRTFDSNAYGVALLSVDGSLSASSEAPKPVVEKKPTSTEEVWNYWMEKYQERYEVKYRPANWAKDKGCMKHLVNRYENDIELLKRIIDVVMRLYDSRWKTKQFTRPTIGQLVSWLAAQAEPFAQKESEPEPAPEITPVDEEPDLFDMIDRKWGV